MTNTDGKSNKNITVIGNRVLVSKEKLDLGGLNVTPAMEDGEKNRGNIIGVGQISIIARLKGVKVGAKIIFHKHFAPNFLGKNDNLVFVEAENILGIEQESINFLL